MSDFSFVPTVVEPSEWLDVLSDYQRKRVSQLLRSNNYEEVASIWMNANLNENSPFGTEKPKKGYYDYLLQEIRKYLCGDESYQYRREEFSQKPEVERTKKGFVLFLGTIIGSYIGLSAVFLAPAIVLILSEVSKVSLNAWCAMKLDQDNGVE